MRNSCKHPVIVLTDIKFVHLKSLINFIYNGEVNIFEEHLTELLRIANILKIKGLEEIPSVNIANENDGFDGVQDDHDLSNLINNSDAEENFLSSTPFNVAVKDEFIEPNDVDATPGTSSGDTGDLEKHQQPQQRCKTPLQGTSDMGKLAKKRKSVSFSETTEIVCSKVSQHQMYIEANEQFGNGKRKLRSSSETCTITKLKYPNDTGTSSGGGGGGSDEGAHVMADGTNNNDMVVRINPLSFYASTKESSIIANAAAEAAAAAATAKANNENNQQKRHRSSAKRQMIRKNENFLRALQAVRDEGIGFCKAAKIHGVNNRTLWLEYQKLGYPIKNARKKSST